MSSPYRAVLGSRLEELHPRLRAYFDDIPRGWIGRGSGVFGAVGTPRRWLWPVLAILEREGIAAATWQRDVPFEVENRASRQAGVPAIRTLLLSDGAFSMVDTIRAVGPARRRTLVDDLGVHRRLRAVLEAEVVDGSLVMRSSRLGIRWGPLRVRVPKAVAPRVELVESFDETRDRQHVAVSLSMPLVGRIYEYGGYFEYSLVEDRRV